MVIAQDKTHSFIPDQPPRLIILGTMVAICARTLNGQAPEGATFYYHNNRNHFWRVMQHLFDPKDDVKKMSIADKKRFLNKHRIMIQNLVYEVSVPNSESNDPSDTILFKAYNKNRIKFKKLDPKAKKIIETTPKFFNCRYKKGISNLVDGFFEENKISSHIKDEICYLPTPTRCNPKARSLLWKNEMLEFSPNLF